jgi:hypothetical protein
MSPTASQCSATTTASVASPGSALGWLPRGVTRFDAGLTDVTQRARAESLAGIVRWPRIGLGILTFVAGIYQIQYLILRFANWF